LKAGWLSQYFGRYFPSHYAFFFFAPSQFFTGKYLRPGYRMARGGLRHAPGWHCR
jgi:hypothetical protein